MRVARLGLIIFALAAIFAAPGQALVHNYEPFGPYPMCVNWDYEYFSNYNYPQVNRVWRPTVQNFALFYQGGAQYEENADMNPFRHIQAGGYTQSFGADVGANHNGWCTVTWQYVT
jgi:hypothetical protein